MNKQKAFTLIELMLSFTIGLLIIGMVYQGYKMYDRDQKVQAVSQMMYVFLADADNATVTRNDYQITDASGTQTPLTLPLLLAARSLPEDYPIGTIVTGNTVSHPFLGNMTVGVESTEGTHNDLFRINIERIPTGSCNRVLNKMAGRVYDMYVNNNLVGMTPEPTPDARGRNEVKAGHAAQLCAQGDFVTLSFRKLKDVNHYVYRSRVPGVPLSTEGRAQLEPVYNRNERAFELRENAQSSIP